MIGIFRRMLRRRRLQEDALTRCRHCRQPLNEDGPELVHTADGERRCYVGAATVATLNRPRVTSYAGEA